MIMTQKFAKIFFVSLIALVCLLVPCFADDLPGINVSGFSLANSSVCIGQDPGIDIDATDNDNVGDPIQVSDELSFKLSEYISGQWIPIDESASGDGLSYSSQSSGYKQLKVEIDDVNDDPEFDDDPVVIPFTLYVKPTATEPTPGAQFSSPAGGCSSCSSSADLGVVVDAANGKVKATLTGEAASCPTCDLPPTESDPDNPPAGAGAGGMGCSSVPGTAIIRVGSNIYSVKDGVVKCNGVEQPLMTYDAGARTLTTAKGAKLQFNPNGTLSKTIDATGAETTISYYDSGNGAYKVDDCPSSVTDSYGNQWVIYHDSATLRISAVEDEGAHKRTEFTYWMKSDAGYIGGEGQYKKVKVLYKVNGNWVEHSWTDYEYNSEGKVTKVTTTDADANDEAHRSVTTVQYYSSVCDGLDKPVYRIQNSKSRVDIGYAYFGNTYANERGGGSSSYGVTQIRRYATYAGTYDDTKDQVTQTDYYRDANGNRTFAYRERNMIGSGGSLVTYSYTKYKLYGYLERFAGAPTTQPSMLLGQPWQIVDSKGNATTFEYSTDNGLQTKVTLPTNDYTQIWYVKFAGKDTPYIDKIRDNRGKYTRYTRDVNHPTLVTKVESSNDDITYTTNREMTYYGDTDPTEIHGQLKQDIIPDVEGSNDMVVTYGYYDNGQYRAQPVTSTFDWWNGTSYQTKTTTTNYRWDGKVKDTIDATGKVTDYYYNSELKPERVDYPAPEGTFYASVYSYTSNTVSIQYASMLNNQYAGMRLEFTSGALNGKSFEVTSNSNVTFTIDGSITSNIVGSSFRLRPSTSTEYYACCGSVSSVQDARGKGVYYQYDDYGRLDWVKNDVSGTNDLVTYDYNGLNQTTEIRTYTDVFSNGRLTKYTYDQLGRKIQVTNPGNGLLWDEYYQYDVKNNVVAKVSGTVSNGVVTNGKVTVYEYDSLSRISKVKNDFYNGVAEALRYWPVQSLTISSPDVSYTYSGGSTLKTQVVDASLGTSTYSYDARGRMTSYTPPTTFDSYSSVSYEYNSANEITKMEVSGGTTTFTSLYSYYKNGWLKQVKGQAAGVDKVQVDYSYDANGNVTKRNNANGQDVQTTYGYYQNGTTSSITHKDPTQINTIYRMNYANDGAGNPLEIDYFGDSFVDPYTDAYKVRYAYDDAGRLTSEDWGYYNWTSVHQDSWTYDWVGNRNPGSPSAYNDVDELNANAGRVYDMLGNLEYLPSATDTQRTRYYYNNENRLSRVDDVDGGSTATTTMTWDNDDNRLSIQKGADSWKFIYNPNVKTPSVLMTKSTVGLVNGYEYLVRNPGGQLLASMSCSSLTESPAVKYYHFDAKGSTVLITDGTCTVTNSFTYDAWGKTLCSTTGERYKYVGQLGYYSFSPDQSDSLSSLMQLGVRLYDPETGTFTQRDPAKDGLNWFGYVEENPVSFVDPSGLSTKFKPNEWTTQWIFNGGKYVPVDIKTNNNCYTYAFDDPTYGGNLQPGSHNPAKAINVVDSTGRHFIGSADDVWANATLDHPGLKRMPVGPCGPNTHVVVLYTGIYDDPKDPNDTPTRDYHWYRQDDDGTFSNKHGRRGIPTNKSCDGNDPITDPSIDAKYWGYDPATAIRGCAPE